MISRFINRFIIGKKQVQNEPIATKKQRPRQIPQFSTDTMSAAAMDERYKKVWGETIGKGIRPELQKALDTAKADPRPGYAMDNQLNVKAPFFGNEVIPQGQLLYFATQTFLGYQICAMLSQQWLISKACLMPAEDAVRKGYEVTINDGKQIDPKILDKIREADIEFEVNKNLIQFVQHGRIFGIRIAMFKVESTDDEYYYNPFNIDGVEPGTYKGISQIDPYWISPQLDADAAGDPSSIHFYEPTWWNIAGKLVHRTHLVIYRTEEVPDILKPSYIYGGVPIPQKIVERVYCAERTANEAPMLALTKRTDVLKVDLEQALASEPEQSSGAPGFAKRIAQWVFNRDNYAIKVIGLDEEMEQFDTSLTDLDEVIMTQFQLVAAASNVPAVKLLGTPPKGFNSTGEFEEASYHEMLESIQKHACTPLLDRHHLLLLKSKICPENGIAEFNTSIVWKPLDAMTAKELAELNKAKAETGQTLMMSGAIDGEDERARVTADPDSGYSGLTNGNTEQEEPNEGILSAPEDA